MTINEAMITAANDIARLDYGGDRWTKNRHVIADSFKFITNHPDCGCVIDEDLRRVWLVTLSITPSRGYHYQRIL